MELRGAAVCRECMRALRPVSRTKTARMSSPQWSGRSLSTRTWTASTTQSRRRHIPPPMTFSSRPFTTTTYRRPPQDAASQDLNALHNRVLELATSALRPDDGLPPTEQRLLYVLEQLHAVAAHLIDDHSVAKARQQRREQETTATSALLGSVHHRSTPSFLTKPALLNLVTDKAEEILRHPAVFISPPVLAAYVDLQSLLHQPASFPAILALYASKPVPKQSSSFPHTIEYTPASPNAPDSAVAPETANAALTAAIRAHNLPLCLDVIAHTFATPAYKRAKLIRRALIPGSLLAATPVLAYTAAQQFGLLQTTMDPAYATSVAFAGLMTYTSVVAALGYIVITTANDQMDRVTWAKGVPLWERWVREEERAALDRVAGAWGFASLEKRGEEEGVEWEALREEVGLRGMVLDQPELMEGME